MPLAGQLAHESYCLLYTSGLARSKGEVRKNASGFRVNGQPCDLAEPLDRNALLDGAAILLSHGKRQHRLVVLRDGITVG